MKDSNTFQKHTRQHRRFHKELNYSLIIMMAWLINHKGTSRIKTSLRTVLSSTENTWENSWESEKDEQIRNPKWYWQLLIHEIINKYIILCNVCMRYFSSFKFLPVSGNITTMEWKSSRNYIMVSLLLTPPYSNNQRMRFNAFRGVKKS